MKRPRIVGGGIVLFTIGALAIGTALTYWLWNWLMPALFGLRTIGFWQAFGLLVLCRVLFGGMRAGGRMRRARIARGWSSLTDEEREVFRKAMRSRCGAAPPQQT